MHIFPADMVIAREMCRLNSKMCIRDSFQMALEDKMARGEAVTECDVAEMLSTLRREQPLCLGESFDTIPALSLIHIYHR